MDVLGGLTRWYAKLRFGSDVEKANYSVRGVDTDIYWINSNSRLKGQCTIFQTLLLNESQLPEDNLARDYVVLHELGHKQSPLWMYLLNWFVRAPLFLLMLIVPSLAVVQILDLLLSGASSSFVTTFILAQSILVALVVLPFIILSWLDEGYAEVFTLRTLGREDFEQARRTLEDARDGGLFWKILRLLMYPPERLIHRFGG